jgi:hypothetical protein
MKKAPFTVRARDLIQRFPGRIPGIPRSRWETEASLSALATLRQQGWHRSLAGERPATGAGEPVPWLTYPMTSWLDGVLTPSVRVFEYGAGASTSWFARPGRVAEIVAVEHNAGWHARLPQPPNGEIRHVPCDDDQLWDGDEEAPYARAIEDGAPWDIVVIDGRLRTTCARVAPRYLTPTGLVILDDSEMDTSLEAQATLAGYGLGRLDFWGFKPGIPTMTCTTAFGRDFNHWLLPQSRSTAEATPARRADAARPTAPTSTPAGSVWSGSGPRPGVSARPG